MESIDTKENVIAQVSLTGSQDKDSEIDIYTIHEQHAGRLVLDPEYVCLCFPLRIVLIFLSERPEKSLAKLSLQSSS